jgi:hypothetical protein
MRRNECAVSATLKRTGKHRTPNRWRMTTGWEFSGAKLYPIGF